MRIAFVSTIFGYPWGGADVLWTGAAEAAIARGDQVLVIIAAETAAHPRIRALEKSGAKIHIRQPPAIGRGRLSFLRDFKRRFSGGTTLLPLLEEWKPQRIIISQGGPIDYIHEQELLPWAEKAGVPFECICQSNSDIFSVPSEYIAMARKRAQAARRFWFVSEANRKLAETQLAMPLSNAKGIQNPMELNTGAIPWPASPPWSFAVVARFDAVCKGLDLLFPALAETLGSEADWTLSLFGRGSDEQYLRELAKYTGLEKRIQFAGYAKDIGTVWSKHHMLLLPSRLEGCALAMLEAMACGRPILATDVGGAAEWVRHDVDGFLCPAATLSVLSQSLAHAWSRRAQWQQMGNSAAERFRSLQNPTPGKTLLEDFS
ncbi:MAG: glycosyltransferase family 4 protein [Chthoniobacterales bacterium]